MNKIKEMLTQEGFLIILIIIAFLLFNWNFIGLPEKVDGFLSYKYLFGVWAIIIVVLFLVSKSNQSLLQETDGQEENDNNTHYNIVSDVGKSEQGNPVKTGEGKDV
ncbi:MAG: hypothetical protein HQK94_17885 [Nitrospirae bacterium]|nr:hypothetical protein [Nitrospirota bacterium]